MRLSSLAREAAFAWNSTRNTRSFATLLAATGSFHVANKIGRVAAGPIDIDISLGRTPVSIRLRQQSGDIFIFYEVLAFDTYRLPATLLDPDRVRTIVDCGANIGLTSLYFSERYPAARIFAIEPMPDNFELLKRNTCSIERIIPIQAALVGTPSGSVRFGTDQPTWGNSIQSASTPGAQHTIEVPALTIPDLIRQHSIDHIDLLKVDIEGGEEDVFRHPEFLAKVGMMVIELHLDYTIEKFQQAIAPFGFTVAPGGTHAGVDIMTARRASPQLNQIA